MMALHIADVNFTNISGVCWRGSDEKAKGLQHVHSTVFARSTMAIRADEVRFLTNSIAVVHGTMELHNVPPPAQGECHFMRVVVKQNGKWLIDDFQNTLIHPPDKDLADLGRQRIQLQLDRSYSFGRAVYRSFFPRPTRFTVG